MPHFTREVDALGAILNIVLAVSDARAHALEVAGLPIPGLINAKGMVDTGASCTCIDPSIIATLRIPPSGEAYMRTPSTGSEPVNVNEYDVSLSIFGPSTDHPPYCIPNLAVVESQLLQAHGFHALIGRDVLSNCVFSYNGALRLYTLAF